MILPLPPPGRRPPLFVFVIAVILAGFGFHSFYYGLYTPSSVIAAYNPVQGAAPWLILTISAASHLQRRQIIRSTWQRKFKKSVKFDARFVISNPDPLWQEIIEAEQETYGDLLILDHENETHKWANTVKSLEAFTHVVRKFRPYTFVTKMDEDSWVDAKSFWTHWLEPRIARGEAHHTYIGRELQSHYPFHYASGQFYTLSWDYLTTIVDLWSKNHIETEHEDVLTARLMYEARIQYNLTVLPLRTAFDFHDWFSKIEEDGSAWAADKFLNVDDQLWHAMAPGAINPHQLKDDDVFLRVAQCYDNNGLKTNEPVDWDSLVTTMVAWEDWKGPAPKDFVGYVGEGRGW